MPDELLQRLRRFHDDYFPTVQDQFQTLARDGQHPSILFIGCSDSRLLPYLLTGAGPGEVFMVRNVGAFVPPHDGSAGYHGTAAAIEFAVLKLGVDRIIVCGHSHCGGIRALYEEATPQATNLQAWLELGREAALPVQMTPEALRRTEQRSIVLQLERLMGYPMVRERVEAGRLTLHGWHYVIEDGEVHVFDLRSGSFLPASIAEHSGTGPFDPAPVDDGGSIFNEIDAALAPGSPGTRAAPLPTDA
ncbi:MAG: carbonic anhydrase [Pseudomonadota bacterium]